MKDSAAAILKKATTLPVAPKEEPRRCKSLHHSGQIWLQSLVCSIHPSLLQIVYTPLSSQNNGHHLVHRLHSQLLWKAHCGIHATNRKVVHEMHLVLLLDGKSSAMKWFFISTLSHLDSQPLSTLGLFQAPHNRCVQAQRNSCRLLHSHIRSSNLLSKTPLSLAQPVKEKPAMISSMIFASL